MARTDDRERIARIIDPECWQNDSVFFRKISLRKADAVLAALGDRLMPELPEWVNDITGGIIISPTPRKGQWYVAASGWTSKTPLAS
jgi:hypothetical protein